MTKLTSKLRNFEEAHLKKTLPSFQIGDTVEVGFTIREGEKTRIQTFSGVLIRRQGTSLGQTITVRKVSYGEGVERTFPLHSPILKNITVVKKSKVRRAKLYYLRKKLGKKGGLKKLMDR